MPRAFGGIQTEVFRVVGRWGTFGPYGTLAAAKGVCTRQFPGGDERVERSALNWEPVE